MRLTNFREAPVGHHQLEVEAHYCVIGEIDQLTSDRKIGAVGAAAVISS